MVSLAQLVRASDCGSEGRGFDPHTSPQTNRPKEIPSVYWFIIPIFVFTDLDTVS